jgi:hypothetical protein
MRHEPCRKDFKQEPIRPLHICRVIMFFFESNATCGLSHFGSVSRFTSDCRGGEVFFIDSILQLINTVLTKNN